MQVLGAVFGVDVSKAKLDVAQLGDLGARSIGNDIESIDAWLASLPAGSIVGVESTGRYHQLLLERAQRGAVLIYVLNAKDVWYYAKALGSRAKTDRLDAQLVARYLAEHHQRLRPSVLASAHTQALDKLLRQRALLVDKRSALRLGLQDCPCKGEVLELLEEGFERSLQLIDKQLEQLIAQDAELAAGRERLRSITGFGARTSALMANLLSRLHFDSAEALVAYCGLDPRADDSGKRRGRRRLSKRGNPHLRRALYLAAFAGCHSKALKPAYQALRQRFSSTEALVILARKLLRAAYAVWKTRQPFDVNKLGLPARPA
jgi:transposase